MSEKSKDCDIFLSKFNQIKEIAFEQVFLNSPEKTDFWKDIILNLYYFSTNFEEKFETPPFEVSETLNPFLPL